MSAWKDIEPHLEAAALDGVLMLAGLATTVEHPGRWTTRSLDILRTRYEAGNAEHKDSWEDWSKDRFLREGREEALDLILYLAMMRVVHKNEREL